MDGIWHYMFPWVKCIVTIHGWDITVTTHTLYFTTFWEPLIGLVPCVVVKCPGTTDGMPHPWLMLTSLSFTYGVPTIICHAG